MDILGWIVLAIFVLWVWGRNTHLGIATIVSSGAVNGNSGGDQFNGATCTIVAGVSEPNSTGTIIPPPATHLMLPVDAPPPLAIQTKPVLISSTGVIQSKVPVNPLAPKPQVRLNPTRFTLPTAPISVGGGGLPSNPNAVITRSGRAYVNNRC